jgi:murein biosynthesis integral membrane protein MurJ
MSAPPSEVDSTALLVAGRNVTLVGTAALLAKLFGIVEKIALAFYFGTGPAADAYFVVTGFVVMMGSLARELTEPVMMPLFVRRMEAEGGTPHARALVRLFLFSTVGVLAAAAMPIVLDPFAFLNLLAPGLSRAALTEAVPMLRIGAIAAVFLGASAIAQTALHGLGRFGLPAVAELAYRAALIAACGAAGVGRFGTLALGAGILIGAAARLILLVTSLSQRTVRAAPATVRRDDVATSLWLLWPLVLGVLFHYLGEGIETRFASTAGPGAIAARLYAKKVVDVPVLLAPYVVSVVGFPYLTGLCARGDWKAVGRIVSVVVRWTLAVFVPIALIVTAFAGPLTALLFERGRFDATGVAATSSVLSIYALGLPVLAIEVFLVPTFYAAGNTGTPAWVGAVGVTLNIAGVMLLAPAYGIGGIAAALVIAKAIKVAILAGCLRRYVPTRVAEVVRHGATLLAALLPATLVAYLIRSASIFAGAGTLRLAARLSFASVAVGATFALGYYATSRAMARRQRGLSPVTSAASNPHIDEEVA